jgi:hypothetical protein
LPYSQDSIQTKQSQANEPTTPTTQHPKGTEGAPPASGADELRPGNGGVDEEQHPEAASGFSPKEVRDEIRGRTRKLRTSDETHPDHDLMEVGDGQLRKGESGFSAGRDEENQRMIVNYNPADLADSAGIVARNWESRGMTPEDAKKQGKRWLRASHDEELIHVHQLVASGKNHAAIYDKMWREQISEPIRKAYDEVRNWNPENNPDIRPETPSHKAAEFERMVIQFRKLGTISEALYGSKNSERRFKQIEPFLGRQTPAMEANIEKVMANGSQPREEASRESESTPEASKSETPSTQHERGPPEAIPGVTKALAEVHQDKIAETQQELKAARDALKSGLGDEDDNRADVRKWEMRLAALRKEEKPAPKPAADERAAFEKQYREAYRQMMSYSPDEAGSQVYAEKMAEMSDAHPDWAQQIEDEEDASEKKALAAKSEPKLPAELSKAAPRYSFGNKQFKLNFESDVDKAAYIAASPSKLSARDADYVAFAKDATGMDEGEVRRHGMRIRASIKAMARDADPGTLTIPKTFPATLAAAKPTGSPGLEHLSAPQSGEPNDISEREYPNNPDGTTRVRDQLAAFSAAESEARPLAEALGARIKKVGPGEEWWTRNKDRLENGGATFLIHPRTIIWAPIRRGLVTESLARTIFEEELIHAAQVKVASKEAAANPGGPDLDLVIEKKYAKIVGELDKTRQGRAAMLAAEHLYGQPVDEPPEKKIPLVLAGPFMLRDIGRALEMERQLIQIRRSGNPTEASMRNAAQLLTRWFQQVLHVLKVIAKDPAKASPMLSESIAKVEAALQGKPDPGTQSLAAAKPSIPGLEKYVQSPGYFSQEQNYFHEKIMRKLEPHDEQAVKGFSEFVEQNTKWPKAGVVLRGTGARDEMMATVTRISKPNTPYQVTFFEKGNDEITRPFGDVPVKSLQDGIREAFRRKFTDTSAYPGWKSGTGIAGSALASPGGRPGYLPERTGAATGGVGPRYKSLFVDPHGRIHGSEKPMSHEGILKSLGINAQEDSDEEFSRKRQARKALARGVLEGDTLHVESPASGMTPSQRKAIKGFSEDHGLRTAIEGRHVHDFRGMALSAAKPEFYHEMAEYVAEDDVKQRATEPTEDQIRDIFQAYREERDKTGMPGIKIADVMETAGYGGQTMMLGKQHLAWMWQHGLITSMPNLDWSSVSDRVRAWGVKIHDAEPGAGKASLAMTLPDLLPGLEHLAAVLPDEDHGRASVPEGTPTLFAENATVTGPSPMRLDAAKPKGIMAHHGSGADFDRFDLAHAGTGEGAAAYGYGVYLAESEGAGKFYREKLKKSGQGFLYKVRVKADPMKMLDWDKPMDQQAPEVQSAVTKIPGLARYIDYHGYQDPQFFIGHLQLGIPDMHNLGTFKDFKAAKTIGGASEILSNAGIPGIKYVDEQSRGKTESEQTRNYVIFNESDIEITHKNGEKVSLTKALSAAKPDTGKPGESDNPRENLTREAEAAGVNLKVEELKGLLRGDENVMNAVRAKIKARTGKDALYSAKPLRARLDETESMLREVSEKVGLTKLIDDIQKAAAPANRLTPEERKRFSDSGDYNAIGDAKKTSYFKEEILARAARKYQIRVKALRQSRELVSKLTDPQKLEFMLRVDEGKAIKPEPYQGVVDALEKMDRQQVDKAKEEFEELKMDHWKNFENYLKFIVPHNFEDVEQANKVVDNLIADRKRILGDTGFLKHRTDLTMREVIDYAKGKGIDLKPRDLNIVDAMMHRWHQQDRYFGAHRMIQRMELNGTGHWVNSKDKYMPKKGEVPVNSIIGTRVIEDAEGNRVKQEFFADEPSATIVNNYLSKGIREGRQYVENYFKASNILNQAQLSLSSFHGVFCGLEGIVSSFGLGLEKVLNGNISGLKDIALAPFSTWHDFKLGRDIRKTILDPAHGSELHQHIVDLMIDGGFRDGQDSFFYDNNIQKFLDALRGHKIFSTVLRAPFALIELAAKPIMEHFVPIMKAAAVYKIAAWLLERKDLQDDPMAFERELHEAVRSGNYRFGQLCYDNLHLNNVVKDLGMGTFRSMGWNVGSVGEIAGGMAAWVKFAIDAARYGARKIGGGGKGGKPPGEGGSGPDDEYEPGGAKFPRITHRMAYVLALPFIIGFFGLVLAAMFGQPIRRLRDLYVVNTGEVDDHGHKVFVSLPSYMKDLMSWTKDPMHAVISKLHPLISMIGEMLQNRDFYGVEIAHSGDPLVDKALQELKFAFKQFVPFSFTNAGKLSGSSVSTPLKAATLAGALTVAPAAAGKSDAQNLADELVHEGIPPKARTQEQADHSALVAQLIGLQRIGKAGALLQQSLASGKINEKDKQHIMKQAALTPLQASVSRLQAPDAEKVAQAATPKEYQEIRSIVAAKDQRAGRPMYRPGGLSYAGF